MRIYDIIAKKRDGGTHTRAELETLINGYVAGDVPDYQMAAWMMAVYLRGMTDEEDRPADRRHGPQRRDGGPVPHRRHQGGQAFHRRRRGQDHPGDRPHCGGLRGEDRQDERPGAGPHRRHHRQDGERARDPHRPEPGGVLRPSEPHRHPPSSARARTSRWRTRRCTPCGTSPPPSAAFP